MQLAGSATSPGGARIGAAASEAHRTSTSRRLTIIAAALCAALLGLFALANPA